MLRLLAFTLALLLSTTAILGASVRTFGKALMLKKTTKISDIYAKPEAFNGQRVRVEGPVVDVCSEKGCWIAIGSDREFQVVRFKVDDGVIVFPMDAKGATATVEGVIEVTTLSEADQIAQQGQDMAMGQDMGMDHQAMAKEHAAMAQKKTFDPKSVKGPKTVIMIKGDSAELR